MRSSGSTRRKVLIRVTVHTTREFTIRDLLIKYHEAFAFISNHASSVLLRVLFKVCGQLLKAQGVTTNDNL